jgi:hypothetical protein
VVNILNKLDGKKQQWKPEGVRDNILYKKYKLIKTEVVKTDNKNK